MTPDERLQRLKRINDLVSRTQARPAKERDTFLKTACPDDPDMRRQVMELLSTFQALNTTQQDSTLTLRPRLQPEKKPYSLIGRRLGPYWVNQVIRLGNMGTVFKAFHIETDAWVHLKSVRSDLVKHPAFMRSFRPEMGMLTRIQDPHLARVHEVSEAADLVFLVMDAVEGQTLGQYLRETGAKPWDEVKSWFMPLIKTIVKIHSYGVVLRGIHPDAIIMQRGEGDVSVPIIADFGLYHSDRTQPSETKISSSTSLLPDLSQQYLSPEHLTNFDHVDYRSDLYTLGMILFEALSGTLPFEKNHLRKSILSSTRKSLGDSQPDVPPALARIVNHAIARNPKKRYATGQAFFDALNTPFDQAPTLPSAEPGPVPAEPEKPAEKPLDEVTPVKQPEVAKTAKEQEKPMDSAPSTPETPAATKPEAAPVTKPEAAPVTKPEAPAATKPEASPKEKIAKRTRSSIPERKRSTVLPWLFLALVVIILIVVIIMQLGGNL